MASGVFIFIFISGVFSVPLVFLLHELSIDTNAYLIFAIGMLSISSVFYVANVQADLHKESYPRMLFKFIFSIPCISSAVHGFIFT